jgi:hypothetical protein
MAVLEWNRAQRPAPISIGKEYFVAKAIGEMVAALAAKPAG